jgi:hypothetical protein
MLSVHMGKTFANTTPYYTMVFVAYDGEERGTEGASAFVKGLYLTPQLDPANSTSPFGPITIVGDVDLDMVGINWPGTNAPINVMANSEALYHAAVNFTKAKGMPDDQLIRKDSLKLGSSDYARFWEVTDPTPIPTIFFISDFEEIGSPGQLPEQIHTPTQNLGLPLVSFGAYPFWHLEDTVETMRLMAGDPPADALPHPNTEKGFQMAGDLAVHLLHILACQPGVPIDATPK